MVLNNNNSNRLENIIIESDTVTLCELESTNRQNIKEMVRNYSVTATALLYAQKFLDDPIKSEKEAITNDETLKKVFSQFRSLKTDRNDKFIDYRKNKDKSIEQVDAIKKDINERFKPDMLFSPYGPIQYPFDKAVEKYISKAAAERSHKPKREEFHLGIKYDDKLIGCFAFDFIENTINSDDSKETYRAIGDVGIFIDPDHREIKKEKKVIGKFWRETLFVAAVFIEKIFKLYKNDKNIYVYATTHPLNLETGGILSIENGWKYICTKETKYGNRKLFVIKYKDFLETYINKQRNVKLGIQATWVKASCVKKDVFLEKKF